MRPHVNIFKPDPAGTSTRVLAVLQRLSTALLLVVLFSTAAWAQCGTGATLDPGDILVADPTADAIVHIDSVTNAQTVVSGGTSCPGNLLVTPFGVVVDASGNIYVADSDAFGGSVIRIDASTGAQTVVSFGGNFIDPRGIEVEASGMLLVSDDGGPASGGALIRVDPATGSQTVVSSGQFFVDPTFLAIESPTSVIVADRGYNIPATGGGGALIRINLTTGVQTILSEGNNFGCPHGVAFEPSSGTLISGTDNFCPYGGTPSVVLRVDQGAGTQTQLSPSVLNPTNNISRAIGFAIEANGNVLVADPNTGIIRVDPATGAQTVIATTTGASKLIDPVDVFVVKAPALPSATDLSVTKTDNQTVVTAGDGNTYTYTIVVRNEGPLTATDVVLTDAPWPSGFQQGTVSTSQGTCTPGANGNFSCALGNIAVGDSVTVTATYTVPASTPPGNQTNTVSVSGALPDTNSGNNTATDSTNVVGSADLSVTKNDGVPSVTAGDGVTYTYTIVVTNNGPSQATNVTLNDDWPSGFNRTAINQTQGDCSPDTGNGDFSCSLGNLAPGASATITASYTVPAGTSGNQTNSVTVQSQTPDSNNANNSASDTNSVVVPPPPSDVTIEKTDSADPVNTGASFSYTLTVTNIGASAATNVTVTDQLPAGVTFVSASGSGWSCNHAAGTVTCTKTGTLAAGASSTITINVNAPSTPGPIVNTATVSAGNETNTGNNSDTEQTNVVSPPPPQQPGKWTGGGQIQTSAGKSNFGFVVERKTVNGPIKGQLQFFNHTKKLNVHSIVIHTLTVVGNKAIFKGTCEESLGGGPRSGSFDFTVTVEDWGEPGRDDTFTIQISDPYGTAESGTPIRSGNIQQHN